jgi:hypothetical protein
MELMRIELAEAAKATNLGPGRFSESKGADRALVAAIGKVSCVTQSSLARALWQQQPEMLPPAVRGRRS